MADPGLLIRGFKISDGANYDQTIILVIKQVQLLELTTTVEPR